MATVWVLLCRGGEERAGEEEGTGEAGKQREQHALVVVLFRTKKKRGNGLEREVGCDSVGGRWPGSASLGAALLGCLPTSWLVLLFFSLFLFEEK